MKGSREGTDSWDKRLIKVKPERGVGVPPAQKLLLDPNVIRSLKAFSNVSFEGKAAVKRILEKLDYLNLFKTAFRYDNGTKNI